MKIQCIFSFLIAEVCAFHAVDNEKATKLTKSDHFTFQTQNPLCASFSSRLCACVLFVLNLMEVNNILRDDAFHLWEIGAIPKASNNDIHIIYRVSTMKS